MEIDAIQELIQLDEDTRKKIDQIHETKFELKQAIEQEKKELSDKAWNDVRERVESTRKELDEKIAENEKTTHDQFVKDSAALTKLYEENQERWIGELTEQAKTLKSAQ